MIPYGAQDITQDDVDAVLEVLGSDFLTQGPKVPLFEQALKDKTHASYALAVNSATSALHIACLALGLSKGDWLWTSPITFVASSNCALYCGATVDFVDIDPATNNMSVEALEEKLLQAKLSDRLPKIVVPVHLCGASCDMKAIHELSKEYGFRIIEDASHAIGGLYKNQPVGSCKFSDITVFSFHPVKIITTAEGGAATTNDESLARKMELLRSHGITRDRSLMSKKPDGGWYYEQIALGFNYRLTDLQAALGISQLRRLEYMVERRHLVSEYYSEHLTGIPVTTPQVSGDVYSALHLYVIRLDVKRTLKSHGVIFQELRDRGVGVNLHYIPVYRQPFYKKMGFKHENFPNAEAYYREAISIPMFPTLTKSDQSKVIGTLKSVVV